MTTTLLDSFPMPKHPLPPRMQRAPEYKNIGSRTKQPRPLEDGNWVCEYQHCNNVNYPRRTQCHQCGRKRGPIGDAVVRAYLESLRTMQPFQRHSGHMAETLGMFPVPHNDVQVHHHMMAPADLNCIRDFDPWRGEVFEKQAHIGQQYLPPDRSFIGRGFFISVATEGRRLAEHLVTLFAASSSDPLGDAGECLASAALWLQKIKCRPKDYQTSNAGMPTSPLMSTGCTTFKGIPLAVEVTEGAESRVSQNHSNSTPIMAPQSASKICNIAIRPEGMQCTNLTWEDFKDPKNNYNREFNNPPVKTFDIDRDPRPHQEDCNLKNINPPEREVFIQSNNESDFEGEDFVTKYVDSLLADSEDDVQYS